MYIDHLSVLPKPEIETSDREQICKERPIHLKKYKRETEKNEVESEGPHREYISSGTRIKRVGRCQHTENLCIDDKFYNF